MSFAAVARFAAIGRNGGVVPSVVSLFETAISPPQDYRMFAALAGVRADANEHPLIVPRGFPGVSRPKTFNEFHLCEVGDSGTDRRPRDMRQSYANELIEKGVDRVVIPPGRSAAWLTAPGLRTAASWLTCREIVAALDHRGCERSELSVEFRIVLTAMGLLDQEYGTGQSRLVFWFDNRASDIVFALDGRRRRRMSAPLSPQPVCA